MNKLINTFWHVIDGKSKECIALDDVKPLIEALKVAQGAMEYCYTREAQGGLRE